MGRRPRMLARLEDNQNALSIQPPPNKRQRRSVRPKVLCLGMSYTCVQSQMEAEGYSWDQLTERAPNVKQAMELVTRNMLNQIDGRDLARCRAMEQECRVDAYTVSQETGAQYDSSKHLQANFNRASFCKGVQQAFGSSIKFRQVILDYFWIPSGTWMTHHWRSSFFHTTLVNLVKMEMLEFEKDVGSVYLPFCLHCMRELVASLKVLKNYYKISFLLKDELEEHLLWRGTSTICPKGMQGILGKNIAQEDVYCTFEPRDVFEAMENANITKAELIKVLRGIEDFSDVRMIRLQPLPQYNPRYNKGESSCKDEVGGFVGLLPPREVERGFDSLLPQNAPAALVSDDTDDEEEEDEEESEEEEDEEIVPVPFPSPRRRRKKLYTIVPDIESYCLLDTEGYEKLTKDHQVAPKKRNRPTCDIDEYYLFSEDEDYEPEDLSELQEQDRFNMLTNALSTIVPQSEELAKLDSSDLATALPRLTNNAETPLVLIDKLASVDALLMLPHPQQQQPPNDNDSVSLGSVSLDSTGWSQSELKGCPPLDSGNYASIFDLAGSDDENTKRSQRKSVTPSPEPVGAENTATQSLAEASERDSLANTLLMFATENGTDSSTQRDSTTNTDFEKKGLSLLVPIRRTSRRVRRDSKINTDTFPSQPSMGGELPSKPLLKKYPNIQLESLMQGAKLVLLKDRFLVDDSLFVAMAQMKPTKVTPSDGVDYYKSQPIGHVGIVCRHCGGQPGFGTCFPEAQRSLSQTLSHTLLKHVSQKCTHVPPMIKTAVTELMEQGKTSEARHSRGGRKVFFERIWKRLYGPDAIAIEDEPRTVCTAEYRQEEAAETERNDSAINNNTSTSQMPMDDELPPEPLLKDPPEIQLEPLMQGAKLVLLKDRFLVNDSLFVAMAQMQSTKITPSNRVGNFKSLPIGFAGISCLHCGLNYFPQSQWSLNRKTMPCILRHVSGKCAHVPPMIKTAVKQLMEQEKTSESLPRHGGRKEFYERIWDRLHGTDAIGVEDEPHTVPTAAHGQDEAVEKEQEKEMEKQDLELLKPSFSVTRSQESVSAKHTLALDKSEELPLANCDSTTNTYTCSSQTPMSTNDEAEMKGSTIDTSPAQASTSSIEESKKKASTNNIDTSPTRASVSSRKEGEKKDLTLLAPKRHDSTLRTDTSPGQALMGDKLPPKPLLKDHPKIQLESLMQGSKLVLLKDRFLVDDSLFVAMAQMKPVTVAPSDGVGWYKSRFVGMSCRHCGGKPGVGTFFPETELSLAQKTTSRALLTHVSERCAHVPPMIKTAVTALMEQEKTSETGPLYGGRKVFFERIWNRLHGPDAVAVEDEPGTVPTAVHGPEEAAKNEQDKETEEQDLSFPKPAISVPPSPEVMSTECTLEPTPLHTSERTSLAKSLLPPTTKPGTTGAARRESTVNNDSSTSQASLSSSEELEKAMFTDTSNKSLSRDSELDASNINDYDGLDSTIKTDSLPASMRAELETWLKQSVEERVAIGDVWVAMQEDDDSLELLDTSVDCDRDDLSSALSAPTETKNVENPPLHDANLFPEAPESVNVDASAECGEKELSFPRSAPTETESVESQSVHGTNPLAETMGERDLQSKSTTDSIKDDAAADCEEKALSSAVSVPIETENVKNPSIHDANPVVEARCERDSPSESITERTQANALVACIGKEPALSSVQSNSRSPPGHDRIGSARSAKRKSSSLLRRRPWTVEEEVYAVRMIHHFNSGFLKAPAGTMLGSYLSDKLNCNPARITEKFAIRKRKFHPAVRCAVNAAAIDKAQTELEVLERSWRRQLELQQRKSAKKAAASAVATKLAATGRSHMHDHVTHLPSTGAAVGPSVHAVVPLSQGHPSKETAVARTASQLDRANVILARKNDSAPAIKPQPVRPSGQQSVVGEPPSQENEEEMKKVQRLTNEEPIVQQTTAGLSHFVDQSGQSRVTADISNIPAQVGLVSSSLGKRPRTSDVEDAETTTIRRTGKPDTGSKSTTENVNGGVSDACHRKCHLCAQSAPAKAEKTNSIHEAILLPRKIDEQDSVYDKKDSSSALITDQANTKSPPVHATNTLSITMGERDPQSTSTTESIYVNDSVDCGEKDLSSARSALMSIASTGSAKSKSASLLRRGPWTVQEEEFAARVIQEFDRGFLDAPAGTTLRSFLSEKLHCDPMRITKKFTGDSCIGKRKFHPAVRCTVNAAAIDKAQTELEALERRWRRRLKMQQRESAKKAAASAVATKSAANGRSHTHGHVAHAPSTGATVGPSGHSAVPPLPKQTAVARTAPWVDRANAILAGKKETTAIKPQPVQPPGQKNVVGVLSSKEIEEQKTEVQKLTHEEPIIQQITADLPHFSDQSSQHKVTDDISSTPAQVELANPSLDKLPKITDVEYAEKTTIGKQDPRSGSTTESVDVDVSVACHGKPLSCAQSAPTILKKTKPIHEAILLLKTMDERDPVCDEKDLSAALPTGQANTTSSPIHDSNTPPETMGEGYPRSKPTEIVKVDVSADCDGKDLSFALSVPMEIEHTKIPPVHDANTLPITGERNCRSKSTTKGVKVDASTTKGSSVHHWNPLLVSAGERGFEPKFTPKSVSDPPFHSDKTINTGASTVPHAETVTPSPEIYTSPTLVDAIDYENAPRPFSAPSPVEPCLVERAHVPMSQRRKTAKRKIVNAIGSPNATRSLNISSLLAYLPTPQRRNTAGVHKPRSRAGNTIGSRSPTRPPVVSALVGPSLLETAYSPGSRQVMTTVVRRSARIRVLVSSLTGPDFVLPLDFEVSKPNLSEGELITMLIQSCPEDILPVLCRQVPALCREYGVPMANANFILIADNGHVCDVCLDEGQNNGLFSLLGVALRIPGVNRLPGLSGGTDDIMKEIYDRGMGSLPLPVELFAVPLRDEELVPYFQRHPQYSLSHVTLRNCGSHWQCRCQNGGDSLHDSQSLFDELFSHKRS